MKKILFTLVLFVLTLFSANAADFYSTYDLNFPNGTPVSMFVSGAECLDNSCTAVNSVRPVELYNGDQFNQCWTTYNSDSNEVQFASCIENARISGNVVNLASTSSIVTRVETPSNFGYVTYFSASGDMYHTKYDRMTNLVCAYDSCVDTQRATLNFEKSPTAIAEIGQLNIVNVDNQLLPVQVTVPVSIEETVCSAFRFSQPSMYRPVMPQGYSDYNANTKVTLTISNANTNAQYLTESINVPIEADTCAGLAAFSWTPSAGLENESIKFRVETDVIDNQVLNSITDWAEVIETIYPIDLDGTCWSRGYDFTLSNVPTFALNTSIAQIVEGETLYAGFSGGAYRDNSVTPMNFNAYFYFNNTLVHTAMLSSSVSLQNYFTDLSSRITNLPAGSYNVTLITTPIGGACSMSSSVSQTQNLQILTPDANTVTFHVRDSGFNPLSAANVNFVLTSADDYYQTTPIYNQDLSTNAQGLASFNNVISGTYTYSVSYPGSVIVNGNVHIASNTDLYITLPSANQAPTVNLPAEMTVYYQDIAQIDLTNYVTDYNDLYSSLLISYNIVSGSGFTNYDGRYLYVSTTTPNDVVVSVRAQDPSGLSGNDTMIIHFINNNAPVINQFVAQPDNGQVNFTTNFVVDVIDADSDPLTCVIEFGDGQVTAPQTCSALNGISHTYTNIGTFNVVLRVNDQVSSEVVGNEQVFVFARTYSSPQIEYFNLTTTNANYVPNDLTLNWNAIHPDNLSMTCTLRINAVNYAVSCANGNYNIANFTTLGTTRFTLIASDGMHQDMRIIDRTFVSSVNGGPSIDYFTLTTQSGNYLVPSNITLGYGVTHPQALPMTCQIIVNGVSNPVLCSASNSFNVYDFNVEGVSNFTFVASDGFATINQTILQLFVSSNSTNNTVDLTLALVDLIIDDVIAPGDFNFGVSIMNETLNSRDLSFKPMISCNGVTAVLNNSNGLIDNMAVSKVERAEGFVYNFQLNTLEFKSLIPTDVSCRFMLGVTDEYGTDIVVTKVVMFKYPVQEAKLQSIRGKGTDIADFMSSAMSGQIGAGYNSIEFNVENNELVDKDITITVISTKLNIAQTEEISLGAGQSRSVTIPMYVSENIASGSYPVRFSVYDGTDKQVRYTYIIVKK